MGLGVLLWLGWSLTSTGVAGGGVPESIARLQTEFSQIDPQADAEMRSKLTAPLLFVKKHSYTGIHIYDTYYKWPPGGGGIYILENPSAPRSQWRIRPVIDPTTPETLGEGVYNHPELSYDATRLLFCFKGQPDGSTSIYEIGIDGRGLRRLTNPEPYCGCYQGSFAGQHDIAPTYLPDGRIAFLSTRPSGLVPCFNSGVAILHVMNADGSDIRPISVNNVNEFDPSVLPDGRILLGRWEYIDKNALTVQSLWTVRPDGTDETALFANNMVLPEAVLDARPMPSGREIVGTFAKHNAPPRGSIALIDPRRGKNAMEAIFNLEHPEDPTFDRGESCEPWPVDDDLILFSGRPAGFQRNILEMIDRRGRRVVLLADPEICLHSPMLVRPRPIPAFIPEMVDRKARTGYFFVQDIYQGLTGVRRGEVKYLRVIEETSRTSPRPADPNPFNQTYLISAVLGWSAKNFLGIVPVEEDGSAYFEVPSGRAVYLQALDGEGRLIQSMRTFVQAAPGVTRSCIGCHEPKAIAPSAQFRFAKAIGQPPRRLKPESWGSGPIDYPTMIQPIFDRHCVRCHGGAEGVAAGLDLTGGWTEYFSISYENLTGRRRTQLVADLVAGIDCMNGTAFYSVQIFLPRSHGSAIAPLAEAITTGCGAKNTSLSRAERDLIMAWIDTNAIYHGLWDFAEAHTTRGWAEARDALIAEMHQAGCMGCHGTADGKPLYFESDWFNLKHPEWSRILRAPLPPGAEGYGLGLCRNRPADPRRQRTRIVRDVYHHAILPLEAFAPQEFLPPDLSGEPVISFTSTADPHYQAMLAIIRRAQATALSLPRVDMPGAKVTPGTFRQFVPPVVPEVAPPLQAEVDPFGRVRLTWPRCTQTWGLTCEVHRSQSAGFTPSSETLLASTPRFEFWDESPPLGLVHYALVMTSPEGRGRPSYISLAVPEVPPPAPPNVRATGAPYAVRLEWEWLPGTPLKFQITRAESADGPFVAVGPAEIRGNSYIDFPLEPGRRYWYQLRSVNVRGQVGPPSEVVWAESERIDEPIFSVEFAGSPLGSLAGGRSLSGVLHGQAACEDGALRLTSTGHASFPNQDLWQIAQPISVECWVYFDRMSQMPVVISFGHWRQAGWFLQAIGGRWRWHVGGIDCDGGQVPMGRWVHLIGSFDGQVARVFQDGRQVAQQMGQASSALWQGPLVIGQYSGGPAPPYQVLGRIAGVRIYHRPITEPEAAILAQTPPPVITHR